MKQNTPYDPATKSSGLPENLEFRLASSNDRSAITTLMAERNPNLSEVELMEVTDREIVLNSTDPKYRLYVAGVDRKVVGLCRFFHSERLPKEKIIYPPPHGWYGSGILVDPIYRRQGIARFLFQNRLRLLSGLGVKIFYSVVDSENLASIKMHQDFGYEEVERGAGFLHITLESGSGILYKKNIS